MTPIKLINDLDPPYCEICGEQHATIRTEQCAMCDDCFSETALTGGFVDENGVREICGRVVRCANMTLLCCEPYGSEHDHGSLP